MEMGNMSKRQQSDQGENNSQRPPMGLQDNKKIPDRRLPLIKSVFDQ